MESIHAYQALIWMTPWERSYLDVQSAALPADPYKDFKDSEMEITLDEFQSLD